jgi:hypothetical protein
MLKYFSYNKIILSWEFYVVLSCGRIYSLSVGAAVMSVRFVLVHLLVHHTIKKDSRY